MHAASRSVQVAFRRHRTGDSESTGFSIPNAFHRRPVSHPRRTVLIAIINGSISLFSRDHYHDAASNDASNLYMSPCTPQISVH